MSWGINIRAPTGRSLTGFVIRATSRFIGSFHPRPTSSTPPLFTPLPAVNLIYTDDIVAGAADEVSQA